MAKKTIATSILQQVETDLRAFLSQHQQLIFNERELQLRIAQFLMNTGCYSNVYPEYNGITWLDKNWRNNHSAPTRVDPTSHFADSIQSCRGL